MKLVLINDFGLRGINPLFGFEQLLRIIERKVDKKKGAFNVVLTDDKTIRQLNREHRKKDKVTDVLTFTYSLDELSDLCGEIYISIPTARKQAMLAKRRLSDELNKLFVHGILHFFGFDHVKEKDFRVMKLLEDEVIISFGGKPYECS
jgi:probable rRNA maturation factor